jgi:hypothetical protein
VGILGNVEILITRRSSGIGMVEQIRQTALKTDKKWLFICDDDAVLDPETQKKVFDPDFNFDSDYDIESFTWRNNEGKRGFQTGLYRVTALRREMIKNPKIPSIGFDIIMQALLKSRFSKEFTYTHPLKNTFRAYMRWGKGRALCLRFVKSKNMYLTNYWTIYHLHLYIGYCFGFAWGLICPMKDETWTPITK